VEVIGTLRRWLRARRDRKLKQVERDSGNMSAKERFDLEDLRAAEKECRPGTSVPGNNLSADRRTFKP